MVPSSRLLGRRFVLKKTMNDAGMKWRTCSLLMMMTKGSVCRSTSPTLETAVMALVFMPIFFVPSIKATAKTLKTQ